MRLLFLAVLLLTQARQDLPPLVAEEVFTAAVSAIDDGDSIVVQTPQERITVHLANADAPELTQPGGPEARAFLSGLVLGKKVTVRVTSGLDRLARVESDGADVGAALIRGGMAWHCPRFADDRDLARAEAEARAARRGLWSRPQPTPPWLQRGVGSCWVQKKGAQSAQAAWPDFSGVWTNVGSAGETARTVRITQDAQRLTVDGVSPWATGPVVYRLDGPTSHALTSPHGPVDIVMKTRWEGAALVVDERRWEVRGEEPRNLRQVFWLDERGLLNVEVSSPQPIGEYDVTRFIFRRVKNDGR
jgi:endonuclease YncB( thermonuclease family)